MEKYSGKSERERETDLINKVIRLGKGMSRSRSTRRGSLATEKRLRRKRIFTPLWIQEKTARPIQAEIEHFQIIFRLPYQKNKKMAENSQENRKKRQIPRS